MKNDTAIQEEAATTIESIKFSTSYSYYYSTIQKNIVSQKTSDMRIYNLSIGSPGLTQRGWTNKWGVRYYESTTVVSLKIKIVNETTILLFLSEKGNKTGEIYHYKFILNPYHYETITKLTRKERWTLFGITIGAFLFVSILLPLFLYLLSVLLS